MKKLIILLLLCTGSLSAQELGLPAKFLSNAKSGTERYIGTDAFGWQYTVTNGEFRKEKPPQVYKYKNVSLGDIFKVDLQNPLQVVLFYKKFNTVVLVDNQLSEISRINFSQIPQQSLIVEAAGLASQNRLWLYDISTQQIGLFDLGQYTFKTLTPPANEGIKFYQSDYNYFYWIDNTNKFYVVNLFGKVTSLNTVPDFEQAQLLNRTAILLKIDNALYLYNPETQSQKHIELAEKSFGSFYYKGQILSIFTDSEIIQYQITLP
jgi:hypothetical protein